jgi:hypothetical protein
VLLALLLLPGCASVAGKAVAASACSFNQAWDVAIASLEGIPLRSADKARGVLETDWVEVAGSTRAGILQREINKERFKYVVEVKPAGTGAGATVLQLREEWSPMGARMRLWRRMPPNPSEEAAMAADISRRLQDKGC